MALSYFGSSADPDDKKLLQQLEEARFRRLVRDAIARQTREFAEAEQRNAEYETHFRESCVPIYQRIADEGVWPFGTRINYFRGRIQVDVVTTGKKFTGFSLSLANE